MDKQWYAWVLKRNRLANVIGYIQHNIPEVDRYFYPQIKKEYTTKKGRARTQERPLYEGYLFLRYDNADEVYQKLNSYPFITTFAGIVSQEEIAKMEQVQGKSLSHIKADRFTRGDVVVLLEGPFKGFDAKVVSVRADQIKVRIEAKILGQHGVDLFYTPDVLEHKPAIDGASVQVI